MALFKRNAMSTMYGTSVLHTWAKNNIAYCYAPQGSQTVPVGLNKPGSDLGAPWEVNGPGHMLTFGANRSGKGAGAIIPALIQYTGSAVVLDPKAANAWATAERRRQLGQRVVILDPWDEVNRRYGSKVGVTEEISKFNPLSVLDPKDPEFAEDVAMLADAVIIPTGTDPHWPESARELVGGLIAAAVELDPGLASFAKVREALVGSDEKLASFVRLVVGANPKSLAARKLERFVKSDNKEIASIRSTAITQTAIFDAATLLSAMETEPGAFDLAELATKRSTLFLILPVDKLQTHGRWLRLILTLCVRAIARCPSPPNPPCLFILDEIGTITPGNVGGGLSIVQQAAGLTAGLGVRLWCIYQDLNQLVRDFPSSWGTFFANAALIQVLRVNDNFTAEEIAKYLGTMTLKVAAPFSAPQGTQPTFHQRPVKFAHEIMRMKQGKELLLYAGGPYLELSLIPYYKEPRFAGRYRDDPNFGKSSGSSFTQTPLGPIKLPPIPAPIREWAKQPLSCAAAVALLITTYAIADGYMRNRGLERQIAFMEETVKSQAALAEANVNFLRQDAQVRADYEAAHPGFHYADDPEWCRLHGPRQASN